ILMFLVHNFTNWSIYLKFDRTERFILQIWFYRKIFKSLCTVSFCRFKHIPNRKMISTFH
ncbi:MULTISPECIES: hypothetical protein, partial [unclassified Bartonella]|uniref:hypothetical protein n=1 Tax=unclassified Bartonella TaxID=2645622 RepID=UPI0035D0D95C